MTDPVKKASDNLLRRTVRPGGAHDSGFSLNHQRNRHLYELAAAIFDGKVRIEQRDPEIWILLTEEGKDRQAELIEERG